MPGTSARNRRACIALILLGVSWTGTPGGVAAQTGRQPEVVLRPGTMDRTVADFGCRIPIDIVADGPGGPSDMAIAVEARDRTGRKLESSGFRTEQLPAVSGSLREMDLQFSRTACGDIAAIVVTSATCTHADGTASSCIDRVAVDDQDSAVAYAVDAD